MSDHLGFNTFMVLLIFLILFGCSKQVILKKPYETSIGDEQSKWIWVKLNAGERYQVYNPFINADTLYGQIEIDKNTPEMIKVGFSLYEISEIREKKIDWIKTTALIVGITFVSLLILEVYVLGTYFEAIY